LLLLLRLILLGVVIVMLLLYCLAVVLLLRTFLRTYMVVVGVGSLLHLLFGGISSLPEEVLSIIII
jgi:hypothetical protein